MEIEQRLNTQKSGYVTMRYEGIPNLGKRNNTEPRLPETKVHISPRIITKRRNTIAHQQHFPYSKCKPLIIHFHIQFI